MRHGDSGQDQTSDHAGDQDIRIDQPERRADENASSGIGQCDRLQIPTFSDSNSHQTSTIAFGRSIFSERHFERRGIEPKDNDASFTYDKFVTQEPVDLFEAQRSKKSKGQFCLQRGISDKADHFLDWLVCVGALLRSNLIVTKPAIGEIGLRCNGKEGTESIPTQASRGPRSTQRRT